MKQVSKLILSKFEGAAAHSAPPYSSDGPDMVEIFSLAVKIVDLEKVEASFFAALFHCV